MSVALLIIAVLAWIHAGWRLRKSYLVLQACSNYLVEGRRCYDEALLRNERAIEEGLAAAEEHRAAIELFQRAQALGQEWTGDSD